MVALPACEEKVHVGVPTIAGIRATGQVTDPSGAGVADATVTFIFHETTACDSPEFDRSSVRTHMDGRFNAGPPGTNVSEGLLPKDVCMDVQAEPPADRPELAPAENGGFVVTLRDQRGGQSLDSVEVDLTLPEVAGS